MANLSEVITGVSIHFNFQTFNIIRSGVMFKEYVVTTAGLLFPHINEVKNESDIEINLTYEKKGNHHSEKGFIAYISESDELLKSITQLDLEMDDITMKGFSSFVVIRIMNVPIKIGTKLEDCFNHKELFRGQDVLVVSTPFGNPLLLNAFSKGIISKIIDENLYLIDSRFSPGSEGAPIYIMYDGCHKVAGLMLSPLANSTGHTGYSICCSSTALFEAVFRHQCFFIEPSNSTLAEEESPIHRVASVVLPIKTPSTSGSSIIVDENGLLVTCSHVINNDIQQKVEVILEGKSYSAKVLCCSSKTDILDIAFLQLNAATKLSSCTFCDTNPIQGEDVYVIGYTFYGDKFLEMISKGTLLKHDEGSLLYASCIVHGGNSGGGMFREDGTLMAIVCGHLAEKDNNQDINYQDLSVGIPINVMRHHIENYKKTRDLHHLSSFCGIKNLSLSKWHLLIKSKL